MSAVYRRSCIAPSVMQASDSSHRLPAHLPSICWHPFSSLAILFCRLFFSACHLQLPARSNLPLYLVLDGVDTIYTANKSPLL
ncbi:hypothetical protein BDV18DRAFT_148947 [Aspergillus unguis]